MRKKLIITALLAFCFSLATQAKPDPKFHIYLCFGQSNMEAGAVPADIDKGFRNPRLKFLAAVDMPRLGREKGKWYTATPPICRENNNLGPVDFFGRRMIEYMPEDYTVGLINVSVAGAKIELWDKTAYKEYIDSERDWMKAIVKEYDGCPYQRLLEMARIAQKDGVIKGMLVHQGESNSEDPEWPKKLAKIHDDLCRDLGLNPADIPLLAGELKYQEADGVCWAFNRDILPHLPEVLPNAHIISALGCESTGDQFHFSTEGMRLLGSRYADKMLELQGFRKPASRQATLRPSRTGIDISPLLSGIFFEDINQSLDGGLCAQLIQNNSFQAYDVPEAPNAAEFSPCDTLIYGWTLIRPEGSKGSARIVCDKPLIANLPRHYDFDPDDQYDDELRYRQMSLRFDISSAPMGIAANGYGIAPYSRDRSAYYSNDTQIPSIPAKEGVSYDLGLYLCPEAYSGSFDIYLENAGGEKISNTVTIKPQGREWKKHEAVLKAEKTEDCRLCIVADAPGSFYLDFVTLIPEASELWMDGKAGALRKDMMQALRDLNPKFMRFPGGCASEGTSYFGQVFWKNSVGPVEERIGFRNHWGYWTSQHIGFYEYLLMAESLGATPLPVLNNGVTCQFAGHRYIAPLETERDRQRFHDIFVKDALDLIEFCNGGTDTEWGALRASMGHPQPFNLKYLGIGNENRGKEFWERFDIMYKAIKAAHPEIVIVSTAGAADAGEEFNANYAQIDSKYPDTIVDEHYYKGDEWFYNNTHRYDPDKIRGAEGLTYDRKRPTRVFVGEFANNGTNNAYASTLAEAAYWTGLERNSDMVMMAAYAPLFCKKGYNKWNSNLIWFDNRGLWRTSNYYYQKLFSQAGDKAVEISEVTNGGKPDPNIYTSATIDSRSGDIYLKFVNAEQLEKVLELNIEGGKKYSVTMEFISSHDTDVKNQKDQNYYSSHPDYAPKPVVTGSDGRGLPRGFPGFSKSVNYLETVVPHSREFGTVSKSARLVLPENSVGIIKFSTLK